MTHTARTAGGAIVRGAVATLLFLACTTAAFAGGSQEGASQTGRQSSGPLRVVAAENFYGDVAAQIGGSYVTVTSILNNPNVDPHEYESSVSAAAAVSNASLVVQNGGGYDAWMTRLLSASSSPGRVVVNAYEIAPVKLKENDHIFYSIDDIAAVAKAIAKDLAGLRPAHATVFEKNLAGFSASLSRIRAKMEAIKKAYGATPVGLTETIFQYQAQPMGLDVLTPFPFQKAVAEGNDPPAASAIAAEDQVTSKRVRVLIYNKQTITKLTTRLVALARRAGIPVVTVTETMPPTLHYQDWMLGQLDQLEKALSSTAGAS